MEIELKLRLPSSALAALRADPLWARTRATRKQLDNIYFDTPQRTLAQAGIGLRLRSDGKHWLQTVKGGGSRAGLHQREEIEFPVKGPALEWAPLAGTAFGPVLEPLKGLLQPQFQTRFKRETRRITGAAGGIIEVAIDEGEILALERSEPLCEIELELKSGPVDDMFALAMLLVERHPLVLDNRSKAERGSRLAQGGAALEPPAKAATRDIPAGEDARTAARLAVEASLAHWQANEAGFLGQPQAGHYDSEYLHQLRVAVRRLRVACGPLARTAQWHEEALMPLQECMRALGQRLGAARDWDVFIEETWPPLAGSLHDAALRQKLQEAAALLQATARLQAQAAFEERDTQRLLLQMGRCLAQPDEEDQPVSYDALTAQLHKLEQQLRRALPRLEHLSPTRLHRLRITAKKLRYLTEFIASRFDQQAIEPWLDWLKKAQTVFGVHNDRVTARTHIEILCSGIEHPGKLQHSLQAALREQNQSELSLPALPEPYWRA